MEGAHRQEEYRYLAIAIVKINSKKRARPTTGIIRVVEGKATNKQLEVNKNVECLHSSLYIVIIYCKSLLFEMLHYFNSAKKLYLTSLDTAICDW
jgi:hypothetical protein